jgi:hypothetical protein
LKRITGIFKIEPLIIIAAGMGRSLFKKNKKNVFTARFIINHAYKAVTVVRECRRDH